MVSDEGLAAYSPALYEVQRLTIPSSVGGGFRPKFEQTSAFHGKGDGTCSYRPGGFGELVEDAPSAYPKGTHFGGGSLGAFGYGCEGARFGWGSPRLGGASHTTNITVGATALECRAK